jgi:Bacterial Ig-like domain (group 3)
MSAAIHHAQVSTVHRFLLLAIVVLPSGANTSGERSSAPTGAMLAPFESGVALVMNSGDALLFGDVTGAAPEIYDAAVGSFSTAAVEQRPRRAGAAGVRLDDGRVLIVGGSDGTGALRSASVFDPSTRAFTELEATMSEARILPTATRLLDGRVLVVGGYNEAGVAASGDIFDPWTGVFAPVGTLTEPRLGSAAPLLDGRVLIAGGLTANGRCSDAVDIFDPSIGSFAPAPRLAHARCDHQAVTLPDGRVLVTGGHASATPLAEAEIFDPAGGTFLATGPLQTRRTQHRSVVLTSGEVLIVGGQGLDGALASSEVYDAAAGTFTAGPSLLEARVWPAVALLPDERVLVAGGRGPDGATLATFEILVVERRPPPAPTSTALRSNVAKSTYGQPVTYYARVSSANGAPAGVVQFVDGGTQVLATAILDKTGAAQATVTSTPAGTRSITAVYDGTKQFESSESSPAMQSVERQRATASLTVSPLQRQYSDRMTLEATVSPPNAAESVTFKVNTHVLGTAPVIGGRARLTPALLGAIGAGVKSVTAVFNQAEKNYEIYNPYRSMSALREDARVTYTGATTVNTGCSSCASAIVRLEATVRDISLVSAATDADPGDVGTATVAFVNRATGAVIQTVVVTPSPNDQRIGKAVYDWPVNLGKSSSQTFTIGMVVGNQYLRNSTLDDAKVTVRR